MSRKKSQHPKVFISYSWDSEEHKDNVVELADRLRSHGIDCNIDQYEASPVEGWQNWMRNQVEESDFVLLVCTEQYKRRFQGKEQPGRGKGVTWEGLIISQLIYDQQTTNTNKTNKFIPVIFEQQAGKFIPFEIKRYTRYLLDPNNFTLKEPGYEALYRYLTQQTRQRGVLRPTVISLPPLKRHQVNPPDNNDQVNEQLIGFYRKAQKYYRTRYWSEAIAVFRQMQQEGLPYYDPDGIYRSACRELVKEEQKRRRLENIYAQGERDYKNNNWYAAQRKFREVLRCQPRDRELEKRAERQLIKTKQKLATEKQLSIIFIVLGWIISVFLLWGIGGFVSGIVIWFISQWTKPLEPSQKILRLFLFIFAGVIGELIIWFVFGQVLNFIGNSLAVSVVASVVGTAISIAVLSWQIRKRIM